MKNFLQLRTAKINALAFVLITAVPMGFVPTTATAQASEVRVTTQTASLEQPVTPDSELLALVAGTEPEMGEAPLTLGKATPLPATTVALDGASEMVTLQPLEADGSPVAHAQMAVRSSDGSSWSPWTLLHSDDEEGPDALPGGEGSGPASAQGVGSVGPIWVGEGTTAIELIAVEGPVGAVEVESFDAPGENSALIDPQAKVAAKVAVTWGGKPAIRSNSEWGSPGFQRNNAGCESGPRYAEGIQAMVVHHTVTTNNYTPADVPKLLQGIHRFHTGTRGWCDVAYNFLVDKFGTIWEGRSGGIDRPVIGGHARGFNDKTFAASLLGQYQSNVKSPAPERPTSAQLQAVQALGAWKLRMHGVDPNGTTMLKNSAVGGVLKHPSQEYVRVPTIMGHRDLGVTSCPGNWTMPVVQEMKTNFTAKHSGQPPYAQEGITGNDFGPKIMAVDTWGGLRPALGQAAPAYPPPASNAIALGGTATAGYVLAKDGTLRQYGEAPGIVGKPGGSSPVDLIVRDSGKSGYVVTSDGHLHGFGGTVQDRSSNGSGVVAGDVNDDKVGYTVNAAGTLFPVLSTPAASLRSKPSSAVIDLVVWPEGSSGYVLTASGEVIGFGNASSFGDVTAAKVVAVVAGPNRNGGWVLDTEGRWISFGDERPVTNPSSNVGRDAAVDGVLTGYDTSGSSFRSGSDAKYIDAVIRNLAGRSASGADLDHWNWKMDWNGGTIALGNAMVRTPRFTDSTVADMYTNALGRTGDSAGIAYWSGLLNSQKISIKAMGINFYGSDELYRRSGSAENYVDKLYSALLHREPDPAGRTYWADLMRRGLASPSDVTAGFYDSLESRRDRVITLHKRVSGSNPAEADREVWAERLLSTDDLSLAAEIIASPSYYRLVTK